MCRHCPTNTQRHRLIQLCRVPCCSSRVLALGLGIPLNSALVRFLAGRSVQTRPLCCPPESLAERVVMSPRTRTFDKRQYADIQSRMMDDSLTIVSLEPMKMVTKRGSLRAQGKSGHHNVPQRKQDVSGVVQSARLCATCQQRTREKEKHECSDFSPLQCKQGNDPTQGFLITPSHSFSSSSTQRHRRPALQLQTMDSPHCISSFSETLQNASFFFGGVVVLADEERRSPQSTRPIALATSPF